MNKNECVKTLIETPDYVIFIFWAFITVIMLFFIGAILLIAVKATCEFIEDRREAYLLNKKYKLQIELMERQKNETRSTD